MNTFFLSLFAFCLSVPLFGEEPIAAARQQNIWQTFMMIGVALLFFYLILWRPEQKRRKKIQAQRSAMQKGDQVTAMGIVGTLVRVEKETAILKMIDGSKIQVLLGAISDVKPASPSSSSTSPEEETGAVQKKDGSNQSTRST